MSALMLGASLKGSGCLLRSLLVVSLTQCFVQQDVCRGIVVVKVGLAREDLGNLMGIAICICIHHRKLVDLSYFL